MFYLSKKGFAHVCGTRGTIGFWLASKLVPSHSEVDFISVASSLVPWSMFKLYATFDFSFFPSQSW